MVELTVVHVPAGQRSTGSWGEPRSTVRSGHQSDALVTALGPARAGAFSV